ncbi:zinc finger CCCH domain-containing protein 11A isoform X2 [Sphaeramia orbicularis]|uniref:zinc finger CCCH domain-containing protein 11A isoform X2 n=1 Tax=Sphaeramia orbicularis TaxID=375764 RepID=UPI00117C0A8A|nr:zinc finger CCCH domain-containing protein 11A-like isoform X2 [Sphaeramia orbicularis]
MTNHGDDCYFYYYSTCTKGDSCPFRHCEAAIGNEMVCNLWQEGRCYRSVCKFRHMEITKNRKEIPCYWENQPAGCQKPHCAFFHEKPRFVDGICVPPDKSIRKNEELTHEEVAPPPPAAPLPTAANPQLRGVMKTESQDPVPSPTHPPVVINPADDDEDEDDQFSEEGDVGPSPRKLTGGAKSGDPLNFGVSTLEEIRLRRALKASMKRAGYPIQSADAPTNGEKENIQLFSQPAMYDLREELRGGGGDGLPLRKSLVERLGRIVDEEPSIPPPKSLKSVKERLTLPGRPVSPSQPAETNTESKTAPEQIRIKTLEEIRLEKAAKSQPQNKKEASDPELTKTTTTKPLKGIKRAITIKENTISHVKTFSEILHAKKKRQEEQEETTSSPRRAKKTLDQKQEQPQSAEPQEASSTGEVRVKTLEEIRREKAARMQAQQTTETGKNPDPEESSTKKPRLLRLNKPLPENKTTSGKASSEKIAEVPEKPAKPPSAAAQSSPAAASVKVKSFEEIMREKRLRKQEMEEQTSSSSKVQDTQPPPPPQNRAVGRGLKRKTPVKVTLSPSSSSQAPDPPAPTQKLPVRKLAPLKSKAASALNNGKAPAPVPVQVPVKSSSSVLKPHTESQSPISSKVSAPPQASAAENQTNVQKNAEPTTDTKVRPKLNVKPSVVKPAVQVKPGPKRRVAERSAVAAVKPLNSASTVLEESVQDRPAFLSSGADTQLISAVPCSPAALLDSSSSPMREELQTVPVFTQSPTQEPKPTAGVTAAVEACTVPQSPVLKTPPLPKSRRSSVPAARSSSSSASAAATSSAVDDFEELISEFADDHLEEDVDPGLGEDDLLQELSDMIDS